jgi:hypothetical protein
MTDTITIEKRRNKEIGDLNSFRPFLMKYMCAANANNPPKLRIKENIRPPEDCLETKANPYRTKNKRGK